jgi:hypothetical protein
MNIKPSLQQSLALIALLGAFPVVAQDMTRSMIPLTPHGYVGVSAGTSNFGLPGCVAGASCDETDIGFKVYAGGQVSKFFGVELSYVDLGRVDRNGGDVRARGVNLGLIGSLPLADQFNVFGKVGAVYGWTRTGSPLVGVATGNKSDMNLSYGVGAQYDIDRQWALRADWDAYRMEFASGRDTVSLISVGGVYKF